jgi:hypothetical protein
VIALPKKKKKKRPQKENKITMNQAYNRMNEMCEQLEGVVLHTLHKEFGFGDKRKERFMIAFKREMNAHLLEEERKMRNRT